MKKVVIILGDVFQVSYGDGTCGYFQYIGLDLTQLNSQIIRVFAQRRPCEDDPDIEEIVTDSVSFYAHVVIRFGFAHKRWKKIGKGSINENADEIWFRDAKDYPENLNVSTKWMVWQPGKDFEFVGVLSESQEKYDIGLVIPPHMIVHKMETGSYDFKYSSF